MAQDRLIYFSPGGRPPVEDVGCVFEDYLGAFAERCYWDKDRYYAILVGEKSWPFRRVIEDDGAPEAKPYYGGHSLRERVIEVWLGNDQVDVLTRRQDEATNRLADGFAALVARYWDGRLDASGALTPDKIM